VITFLTTTNRTNVHLTQSVLLLYLAKWKGSYVLLHNNDKRRICKNRPINSATVHDIAINICNRESLTIRLRTSETVLKMSTNNLDERDDANDDMIQLGSLRSHSLFQFVQITDACSVYTFTSSILHTINRFKSGEFRSYR